MALIDARRKIKKEDKERLKEVSKKIKKCKKRYIGRIQRHQELLEHQTSEEKDTHPKDKK